MSSIDHFTIEIVGDKPIKIALAIEILSNIGFLCYASFATETYLKDFIIPKHHNFINPVSIQFYQWWLSLVALETILLFLCLPSQYGLKNKNYTVGIIAARKFLYWALTISEFITPVLVAYFVYTVNLGTWLSSNLAMFLPLFAIVLWRLFALLFKPSWFGTIILTQKKTQ